MNEEYYIMNDERMDDGRIYKTKRKIGETQLDKRETQGINARDFRIAKELYKLYRDESDHVYIWNEHLPFILDNIPLLFGIDENNHEEILLFQLLVPPFLDCLPLLPLKVDHRHHLSLDS